MAIVGKRIGMLQKEAEPIPGVRLEGIAEKGKPIRWGDLILASGLIAGILVFCYVGYYFYATP